MPQSPTTNMALIKPTELGDSGVWASLLDAMFDLIDQHDHSTGKGVRVPLPGGVTVGADVSWSSGGSYFAVTDLKAIDFQPQAASAMTSYAGALFVDSATNELNWRTTSGANVRLTNGTSINVSLAGVIGGDYASVGALVDFTDGTDTYAMRQQIGAGVRQFARLQTGDVDLYEFKAHPAAGVPANRVRHKSPTSLAASYDLTWPAALPSSVTTLQVDNTGAITAGIKHGIKTITIPILPGGNTTVSVSSSSPSNTTPPAQYGSGAVSGSGMLYPIFGIPIGARIVNVRLILLDEAGAAQIIRLFARTVTAGSPPVPQNWAAVGSTTTSSGTATVQTLSIASVNYTVPSDSWMIGLAIYSAGTSSTGATKYYSMQVDYDQP